MKHIEHRMESLNNRLNETEERIFQWEYKFLEIDKNFRTIVNRFFNKKMVKWPRIYILGGPKSGERDIGLQDHKLFPLC